jgi:hypothetical protein
MNKTKERPSKRWRENIKDILQQCGLTIKNAKLQTKGKILKIPLQEIMAGSSNPNQDW